MLAGSTSVKLDPQSVCRLLVPEGYFIEVLVHVEDPIRVTDCGLLLAVASVSINVAVRVPNAVGENFTVTVQEPDVIVDGQPQSGVPFVHVKSPGFVPPKLRATWSVDPEAPVLFKTVVRL
jgi:hypothetical protein